MFTWKNDDKDPTLECQFGASHAITQGANDYMSSRDYPSSRSNLNRVQNFRFGLSFPRNTQNCHYTVMTYRC